MGFEGAMPEISLSINGAPVTGTVEGRTLLVEFIRETMKLTGTHTGCDTSQCGACTVHLDGKAVKSCTMLAVQADGAEVTTIEGLHPEGNHPIQVAWRDLSVPQCGFCQSGQIMQAAALLKENPKPSDHEILEAMAGNVCRCGCYQRIVEAVRLASAGI